MAKVNYGKLFNYRGCTNIHCQGQDVLLEGGREFPQSGSMYSNGQNGTGKDASASISVSVAKALLHSCTPLGENLLLSGATGCVAYDETQHRAVAEIHNPAGNGYDEKVDICIYSDISGAIQAGSIVNGTLEQYKLDERCGTVVLLAMLPSLFHDTELLSISAALKGVFGGSTTPSSDFEEEARYIATASDNIYFRVKNGQVKLQLPASGNLSMPNQAALDSGIYAVNSKMQIFGNKDFEFFVSTATSNAAGTTKFDMKMEDFLKNYQMSPKRTLSRQEKLLVPKLEPWVKIEQTAVRVCNSIVKSTERNRPKRNVLLRGPAGTGKTKLCDIIAAGLGLPRTHITCDAGMELFNIVGTILPATDGVADMTPEELADAMDLPTIDDIVFDMGASYRKLAGLTVSEPLPEGLTQMEVIELLFSKQMEYIQSIVCKGQQGKDFVYVPSELIKAVKYGWLCEVQEPTVIIQPGVLPGLNSLLEGGSISLPTGEIVERHPDSVIVFTTNTDYEGCRKLNESVLDRFPIKMDVDLPSDGELIERAMSVTGCTDKAIVNTALQIMDEIRTYLFGEGESTANVGPRTLYDWIEEAMTENGDLRVAAEITLLPSVSEDREIREHVRDYILPMYT